jgi:CubicO group peptidase (beta-lactamase class C family)
MPEMTRRTALQQIGCATAACLADFPVRHLSPLFAEDGQVTASEREAMARAAQTFMEIFAAPALSVAIARNGRMVYEQAFGRVNRDGDEPLRSSNMFRIASVTKPITSVTIFHLVEQGRITLSDTVFGKAGILGTEYGTSPYRGYVEAITVDHLLTHTSGGWQNDSGDPMFRFREMDRAQLIGWTLDHVPLVNPPGEHFAYSNFGYCVLGRVIEKVAGQPYSEYVRREILPAFGISDMRIASNTLKERAANEVVYFGQGEDPYNMNVARMDSHGGWLATASDLACFAGRITGYGTSPSLLKRETVAKMVSPGPASSPSAEVKYARGWFVRNDGKGNWWHGGSLPGSTTIMVRTASGFSWAALCNTRRLPAEEIDLALDNLVWEMARKVSVWGV